MTDAACEKAPTIDLLIAGSRNISPSVEEIDAALQQCGLTHQDIATVISGTAEGVDKAGERWAEHHKIEVVRHPARWSKFGMAAGKIRNAEMVDTCSAALYFWDGKSAGTAHCIAYAAATKKPIWVVLLTVEEKRIKVVR